MAVKLRFIYLVIALHLGKTWCINGGRLHQWWKVAEEESQEEKEQRHGVSMTKNQTPPN
ncbi:hypothetical protein J1N35_013604 [Gossypium stocksii]|uniref:Uncharacterized protein n=1 Tax=Gossypium stocksii TaxID=47602 RepID=A0A9D3VU10_9ROSI|nr:hypothetical protein J1N35_013604 [Gossypium stocksii]